MKSTHKEFNTSSAVALTGLLASRAWASDATISAAALAASPPPGSLRICFFTDSHLPGPHSHEHDRVGSISDQELRCEARIREAFDKANSCRPEVYIFGGDNVFAVDQGNSGDNANQQFENWQSVVRKKVGVPHHSIFGNHDLWQGSDPKAKATFNHQEVYWGHGQPHPYHEKVFPPAQHKDMYNV